MKTWNYRLPNDKPGEGWAHIILTENGVFTAVSDWGNYTHWWNHTGTKDFREFFLSAERDWQYFAHKLRPEKILNEEASFKRAREEVLRQRRTKDLSAEQAEAVWGAISYHDSWAAFLESIECEEAFDAAYEFSVYDLHPDVVSFCKRVLPRLAQVLKDELSGTKAHNACAQEVVIAQRQGFHITEERRKEVNPHGGLLTDHWVQASCDIRGTRLYPHQFPWKGARQGIEQFIEVLKTFEGQADLIILWSTGERTGYRLDNHRVTEHPVNLSLLVQ